MIVNPGKKIAYLDGIRGVAAFLVFFHHFLLGFYPAYFSFDPAQSNIKGLWDIRYGQSIFSVLSNGNFCVFVFFVLSGFVLSRKYFETQQTEIIISGAQRRFVRLYIPVAFTLCLSFLLMTAGLYFNPAVSIMRHSEWWMGGFWTFLLPLRELGRCLLFDTMFCGNSNFDTSLWTIAAEFSGSLFVFAFLALTHKLRRKGFILLVIFAYCFLTVQPILAAFVAGISLNYVLHSKASKNKFISRTAAFLLLPFSLYLGAYPSSDILKNTWYEHLGHTIQGYPYWFHMVGAFCLIVAFVLSPTLQSIASIRPLRFLGRISFSLYLLHPILIGSLSCYMYLHIYKSAGLNHSVLYVFLVTSVVCILLSWLMTKYIDEKGVQLSKYIYTKWFKNKKEAEA